MNKNLKAETTIMLPKWIDKILWKFGANKRKRILKFFGFWTVEDELFEILSEEIRHEIDNEILENILLSKNTQGDHNSEDYVKWMAEVWKANDERNKL
jgi:hypothetical protein